MVKSLFLIFVLCFSITVQALEVDEKLTLRIVNTSESKKTLLVNRGIEDGLAKGDHAKFFVSSGVVARGVCIKLSPTRSVWSIYRVVNAPFLVEDQVMKLKITPAVKITKDESRMLVSDDSRLTAKDPRDLGIPLADGADDLRDNEIRGIPDSESEFEDLLPQKSLLSRNYEVFGMFHYSSMAEKSSPDTNTQEFKSDVTNMYVKLGGEWYFRRESNWYHRFSFLAVFIMDRRESMSHFGTVLKDETNEFGMGVNLNLFDFPSKTYTFIHYVNYTFALGSSKSTYENGSERTANLTDKVDASVVSNQFGYGVKYYTPSGFGMRAEFSYILRSDTYNESADSNIQYLKTRVGPKFQVGLSYRF